MTIGAILWRRLVKQDRLALHLALQRMAHRTGHVGMTARQRKWRALVMVERRRGPALDHMAIPALCGSVFCNELATMRIGMAGFALLRSPFELDFMRAWHGFMAIPAGYCAVRSFQWELCFGMVESVHVDPGSSVVACLAALQGSISALLRHAFVEFPLMRIRVTRGAGAIFEMERQDLVRPAAEAGLVAFRAWDRRMGPGENEARVFVLRDRERRAIKIFDRVAILAAVPIRRPSELPVVGVLMTVRASRELHLINSVLAGRDMAFPALDRGMLSLQRIASGGVFFHAE